MDLFDGHCDTVSRCWREGWSLRSNPGNVDLERGGRFGAWGQFFALFAAEEDHPGIALEEVCRAQYTLFQREMAQNKDRMVHCRTGEEARAAFAAGKGAAFLSVEGAQLLGCSLEGLERAFRMGVRAVNPVWNHANRLCGSCAEEPERGLTAQGRTFCRRMEALGILVDVSHMSDAGFWDVAETLEGPFIASHSNARALCPHPRNLTDEMMREIIRRGGVAGINLFRAFLGEDTAGLEAVVAHIEHFLALGGEKNVALGGDLDGCGDQFPAGFAGIQDMEQIVEALLRRNYREELLHAIFFDNLMRVVNQVCTM